MKTETKPSAPPVWAVIAAFGAVYVIWGSTYLGIRYAVESIPPFLLAGARNLAAGLLLYAFVRLRGGGSPSVAQWRDATIAGALMLLIGNGGVTWAQQTIPSGVTALLLGLTPMWMVLFEWWRPMGVRPAPLVITGLAVGFAGVALLAHAETSGSGGTSAWGVAVVMAASICWALGSIFNRSARKPASPLLAGAMQLIAGGILLLAVTAASGEAKQFSLGQVTPLSFGAWLYLMIAGSLVAYSAYLWLLQVSTPARVATNGYVNPLIAVVLGCSIGREPLSPGLLMGGTLVIFAVALIVRGGARQISTVKSATAMIPTVARRPLTLAAPPAGERVTEGRARRIGSSEC